MEHRRCKPIQAKDSHCADGPIQDYVPGSRRSCSKRSHNCHECGFKPHYCECATRTNVESNCAIDRHHNMRADGQSNCAIDRHKASRLAQRGCVEPVTRTTSVKQYPIERRRSVERQDHHHIERQSPSYSPSRSPSPSRRSPTMIREREYVKSKIDAMPKKAVSVKDGVLHINADLVEKEVEKKVSGSPMLTRMTNSVKGYINDKMGLY